ncbi:hypothetical protein BK120_23760 [Paenibacillus sp. FSL A5-0031]|nr:hypothetical protein BK120_23760 [Paenibacillus sp. FSL A5-0031]
MTDTKKQGLFSHRRKREHDLGVQCFQNSGPHFESCSRISSIVYFEFKGKQTILDARPEQGHVQKVLSTFDEEIKALKLLQRNVFEQKERAEMRQFGREYFDY